MVYALSEHDNHVDINKIDILCEKKIKTFAYSKSYILILTEMGEVNKLLIIY